MNIQTLKASWAAGSTVSALSLIFGAAGLLVYLATFEVNTTCALALGVGVIACIAAILTGSKIVQYVSFLGYVIGICVFAPDQIETITNVIAAIDASGFETSFIITVALLVLTLVTSFAATIVDLRKEA